MRMAKKKLFSEETKMIDSCQCVYCGHIFSGRNACNADMDRSLVKCPKCEKEMQVFLSIEYTCVPMEV
jgi:NAD-dependent SIR2 family protein deacetylase